MGNGRTVVRLGFVILLALVVVLLGRKWLLQPGRAPGAAGGGGALERRAASETAPATARLAASRSPAEDRRPLTAVHPSDVEDEPASNGAIEGFVRSADTGQGISAEIAFAQSEVSTCHSGADGHFLFNAPRPGLYQIAAVTADGFLPFAPEWGHSPITVMAVSGRRVRGVTIVMKPAVEYVGAVVDPSHQPVPGAEVRVLSSGREEQVLVPLRDRYRTDLKGEFRFRAPDDAVLEANHSDFASGRARLDFAAQVSHRLVIRLRPGRQVPRTATIQGVVLDPSGLGLDGAVVTATYEHANMAKPEAMTMTGGQATSDPSGRFVVEGLDPGSYRLAASKSDLAPAEALHVPASSQNVTLRLGEGAAFHGRVYERASEGPIAAFEVRAWRAPDPLHIEPVARRAFAAPTGEFDLRGLPSGELHLSVVAPLHEESAVMTVNVSGRTVTPPNADFELGSGARLTGLVLDKVSKRPIEGAKVRVEGAWQDGSNAPLPTLLSALTDQNGHYEIAGIKPATVSLLASAPDHHGRVVSNIVVTAQAEVPPTTIELTPTKEREEPHLELVGIGAALAPRGSDALVIGQVLPSGGASEAGLQPDDLVLAIGGKPIREWEGFDAVVSAIRGPQDTIVTLLIKRGEAAPMTISVKRKLVGG